MCLKVCKMALDNLNRYLMFNTCYYIVLEPLSVSFTPPFLRYVCLRQTLGENKKLWTKYIRVQMWHIVRGPIAYHVDWSSYAFIIGNDKPKTQKEMLTKVEDLNTNFSQRPQFFWWHSFFPLTTISCRVKKPFFLQ